MWGACVSTSRAQRASGNVLRQLSFLSLATAGKVYTQANRTRHDRTRPKKPTLPYLLLFRMNGLLVMDIWPNAFFSEPVSNRYKFLTRLGFFLSNKPVFTTNYSQNVGNYLRKAGFPDFINGTPTCVIFFIFNPENCTHYLPWDISNGLGKLRQKILILYFLPCHNLMNTGPSQ